MTSPSPGGSAHGPADTEDRLVLIVDDNGKNRKLARDVLRAGGLRTLEAGSGAEAIALAAEHVPDVILMDLGLPDMDGIDAARRLKGGERTARIPVVALSALPLERYADRLLAAGFAGYLEKPISVAGFAEQVRRYFAKPGG
ncbi:MAG: response regulator [Actinobacteria bacterium]|nr:response regulator [Actinomycetota bacterium]